MTTRVRDIAALLITGVALVLLAAAMPGLTFAPIRPLTDLLGLLDAPGGGGGPSGGFPLLRYLLALFWVLLAVAVVVSLIIPELRRFLLTRILFLLAFILIASALFDAIGQRLQVQNPPAQTEQNAPPPARDADPAQSGTGSRPLPAVAQSPAWLNVLVAAAVAAVIAVIMLRVVRRRKPASAVPDARELLADEAQQAIVALQRGADLRSTILACYEAMCRVLREERGLAANATLTPREFEALLGQIGVDDTAIHRLSRLFERVRYGRGAPDAAAAQEAEFCLQAVVAAHGSRE